MDMSSWSGLLYGLLATPLALAGYLASINWYAWGIAVLVPLLMLLARHEIRLRRLRSILDFMTSFNLSGITTTTPATAPAGKASAEALVDDTTDDASATTQRTARQAETDTARSAREKPENPSFEYVKSKYISDLKIVSGGPDQTRLNMARTDLERINIYIEIASRPFSNINARLYVTAFGFMLVSYYGFRAFFAAFGYGHPETGCNPAAGCGMPLSQAVGAFAFAGAYIAAVRLMLRRLAVFDLNAFSFLWQSVEVIATVLLVVLIFNAFPDPLAPVKDAAQSVVGQIETQLGGAPAEEAAGGRPAGTGNDDTTVAADPTACPPVVAPTGCKAGEEEDAVPASQIPLIWLALAPVLGLLPQSAGKFLLVKMQSFVLWWKTSDDRFTTVTRLVSLDIIDGIDFATRFRLEECGIYDVQNLATYNPIMMFIETPYGIYQCIDWAAQAQLCHILGPEKFLMFRELNIRTIFDLERAIDSIDSPESYDAICAAVLLAPTDSLKKTAAITGFEFVVVRDGEAELADTPTYFKWLHRQISASAGTTKAIEHLTAWISDDLHVRRLRRLWNDIADSLEPNSEFLKDSKRTPANKLRLREAAERQALESAAASADEQSASPQASA